GETDQRQDGREGPRGDDRSRARALRRHPRDGTREPVGAADDSRSSSRRIRPQLLSWSVATREITSETELREILGSPNDLVVSQVADRLNALTRQFVERSPFVCVATARPDGGLDVSPRGDPSGFVRILDERTLLMPDRPGNRLADTLTNLLADDRIALLFLIPGVGDTFRVNGRARIVDDAD